MQREENKVSDLIKSDSIIQLAQALSLAQGQIKPAEMNRVNPFLKNKYADLGSIIAAVREPLATNGLAFSQLLLSSDPGVLTIQTLLLHKSGEYIGSSVSVPVPTAEKGRSASQEAGAIITYYRRYTLAALLGVYAEEDNDGTATSGKNPPKEPGETPNQIKSD